MQRGKEKFIKREGQNDSPHDANTGSSGCLAIDRILPAHLPRKEPNNFPEREKASSLTVTQIFQIN